MVSVVRLLKFRTQIYGTELGASHEPDWRLVVIDHCHSTSDFGETFAQDSQIQTAGNDRGYPLSRTRLCSANHHLGAGFQNQILVAFDGNRADARRAAQNQP
jgi:hypothetical protein